MKKLILVFIICLLLIPINTLARECTSTEKSRFGKLANEIQTTFDYTESNNDINFSISFHNVYKDFYLMNYSDFDVIKKYRNTNGGIIVANEYSSNKTYNFSVLYNGNTCASYIVKTIKVTTPAYNKYYKDSLCDGIETYSLCQKWNNIDNISYEDFKKKITSYKKQLELDDQTEEPDVDDSFFDKVRNFIANYYIYMTLGAVLLFIVIIFIYNKRKKNQW